VPTFVKKLIQLLKLAVLFVLLFKFVNVIVGVILFVGVVVGVFVNVFVGVGVFVNCLIEIAQSLGLVSSSDMSILLELLNSFLSKILSDCLHP
jgi:hypothetical protein